MRRDSRNDVGRTIPAGDGLDRWAKPTLQVLAALLVPAALAIPAAAGAGDEPAARVTVVGRVLDPHGQPVPDAAVMVIVRSKLVDRPTLAPLISSMTAQDGRCDGSGGFRVELPRTSSARHDGLIVTALAPGHGMGWAELDPDADSPAADVALRPEQVVRGRLFDVQGRPARGVAVTVDSVLPGTRIGIADNLFHPDVSRRPGRDRPAWPGPAIGDAEGRFTLRGLGRDLTYRLVIDDPRFALQATVIQVGEVANARPAAALQAIKVEPGPDPRPIAIALQPAQVVTGRVTYADTGRPVSHALVAANALFPYEADGDGRFRVSVPPTASRFNSVRINAQSPEGAPYLLAMRQHEWPKGTVEASVDIALPRGSVVRGQITEEDTGRPVAGAVVRVAPDMTPGEEPSVAGTFAVTGPDGTYRVAATPGHGYLVVQGPDDYVLREFGGDGGVFFARPGHERLYAHAYRAVDLKPGGPEQVVDVALRRGATIRGRVVGPDGQSVRHAVIYSLASLWVSPTGGWRLWNAAAIRGHHRVRDGRFILHGLDPDGELPVYVLAPELKLGAAVRLSGRSATAGPVTVQLEPCGSARARLVDPEGEPIDRYPAGGVVWMVVTPGSPYRTKPPKDGTLFANESFVNRFDTVNYPINFQSDAEGRIAFPALIPGASYRVVDRTPALGGGEPAIRKEFTVKPGEALDLGDILIAKPRRRD